VVVLLVVLALRAESKGIVRLIVPSHLVAVVLLAVLASRVGARATALATAPTLQVMPPLRVLALHVEARATAPAIAPMLPPKMRRLRVLASHVEARATVPATAPTLPPKMRRLRVLASRVEARVTAPATVPMGPSEAAALVDLFDAIRFLVALVLRLTNAVPSSASQSRLTLTQRTRGSTTCMMLLLKRPVQVCKKLMIMKHLCPLAPRS
jgi:hypothetical protein